MDAAKGDTCLVATTSNARFRHLTRRHGKFMWSRTKPRLPCVRPLPTLSVATSPLIPKFFYCKPSLIPSLPSLGVSRRSIGVSVVSSSSVFDLVVGPRPDLAGPFEVGPKTKQGFWVPRSRSRDRILLRQIDKSRRESKIRVILCTT